MAKRKKTAGKSRPVKPARAKTQAKSGGRAKPKARPKAKTAAGRSNSEHTRKTATGSSRKPRAEGVAPRGPAPPPGHLGPKQPVAEMHAPAARRPAKSKLTPDDLAEFRAMLLEKRAQLVGDVQQLQDETLKGSRQDATGDLSSMPIHMADLGSDNWDQEFNLVLIQNERNLLKEIDEALARIEDGTYGLCLATGRAISKTRLRAKPWAKHCIEYARMMETGHG